MSVSLAPPLQSASEAHDATDQAIKGLHDLVLNTGSALIGAAAIVRRSVLVVRVVSRSLEMKTPN